MKHYEYPLDQFLNHFEAMMTVRRYQDVYMDYDTPRDPLHVGESKDWDAQLLRIHDYMAQVIPDRIERLHKAVTLYTIMNYVATNFSAFEKAGLTLPGEGDGPSFIAGSVLEAVHFVFAAEEAPNSHDVDTQKIIDLAKKFEERDAST